MVAAIETKKPGAFEKAVLAREAHISASSRASVFSGDVKYFDRENWIEFTGRNMVLIGKIAPKGQERSAADFHDTHQAALDVGLGENIIDFPTEELGRQLFVIKGMLPDGTAESFTPQEAQLIADRINGMVLAKRAYLASISIRVE